MSKVARLSGSEEYAEYLLRARQQFEQGSAATLGQVRKVYRRAAAGIQSDINKLTPGTLRQAHLVALQTALDKRATEMSKEVLAATHQGIWMASGAGSKGVADITAHMVQGVFPAVKVEKMFAGINERATLAMLARTRQDGLKLSDRVWRTSEKARNNIRIIVEDAVARGQDARTTAKQVQQYLQPGVFKAHKLDVRQRLRIDTDVSYQAMRLARTEMNNAFHEGTIAVNQHSPGYRGVYWRLSSAHVVPDICTDMAADMGSGEPGFYPKGEEPVRPHPQCMCVVIPSWEPLDQYTKRLREWRDNPQLHPDIEAWYNAGTTRQILGHASEKVAMIDTVMNSLAISKFDDTHKVLIRADLEKASDAHLRVVEKAIGHVEVNVDGKGTSFYRARTGYIEMNMKEDARENIRTFWHEFGHYIDDDTMYKVNGLKLETLKDHSGRDIEVFSATSRASRYHAYRTNAGIPDLQRFLDQIAPGKYEVRGPNYANIYLKETKTQVGEEWGGVREDFWALVDEINAGLKHQLGADASEQYLRSLGKPLPPGWSDYWVEYRTPKRQVLKSKPAYKGAEDAYRDAYNKYVDELDTWKKIHPNAHIEANRLYSDYVDRANRFHAITDLLEGQAHGEMGMRILWGGHSSTYFKTGTLNISEGWANWFQLSFQNDVEMLIYLKQFAPVAKRIFEECFVEMVRQTFGG